MKKRVFTVLLISLLAIGTIFAQGESEEAGIKDPVTMYVDVAVGGARDVRARIVADYLAEELGVPVNVENIKGAGGVTCATHVLTNSNTPNDLFFGAISTFAASPIFTETAYTIDDYIPLAACDSESFGIFTCPAKTGINNVDDLKAYASKKELIYGSGGVGNVTHLYQAGLYKTLGFNANTLAHNGAVIGITNCMGGHNAITMAGIETARSYVENGDIVPIMTFNDKTYEGYEGFSVPAAKDVAGDDRLICQGLMFISCLQTCPEGNVEILRAALDKVMHNPQCVADLKNVGAKEILYMTTDEIVSTVKNQYSAIEDILEIIKN